MGACSVPLPSHTIARRACPQVNSATLRPVLIATIKDKGFGKLLKEEKGPFDCSESWIRNLCRKLKWVCPS